LQLIKREEMVQAVDDSAIQQVFADYCAG